MSARTIILAVACGRLVATRASGDRRRAFARSCSKSRGNVANEMGEHEVDEVFRGVSMAQMSDEGRLTRVHDSTVMLEVCPRQFEAQIRVVKGSRNFSATYMHPSSDYYVTVTWLFFLLSRQSKSLMCLRVNVCLRLTTCVYCCLST